MLIPEPGVLYPYAPDGLRPEELGEIAICPPALGEEGEVPPNDILKPSEGLPLGEYIIAPPGPGLSVTVAPK